MGRGRTYKPDGKGQIRVEIGWEEEKEGGGFKQHKFGVGRKEEDAKVRTALIERMWQAIVAHWEEWLSKTSERPLWGRDELAVAVAIGNGEQVVHLEPKTMFGVPVEPFDEAKRVRHLETLCPWVKITVDCDPDKLARGDAQLHALAAAMAGDAERTMNIARRMDPANRVVAVAPVTHTLQSALKAFMDATDARTNIPKTTKTPYRNQITTLMDHYADMPLSSLDADAMVRLEEYWGSVPRPLGKRGSMRGRMLRPKSCFNELKKVREFWKWLNRAKLGWTRPANYEKPFVKIDTTPEEKAAGVTALRIKVWSVEELTQLWTVATPKERAWMAICLNCGAGMGELGRFTTEEVLLHQPHQWYTEEGYTEESNSWMHGLRNKTSVYGEWRLWDVTVKAVEWLKARRPATREKALIVNELGRQVYTNPKDERSSHLANGWVAVVRRARKKYPGFRQKMCGFNLLKKTGKDFVKKASDGEVAGYHIRHGQPCKADSLSDLYSNRDFAKLHDALGKVREKLAPVFDSVTDPFPSDYSGRGCKWTPPKLVRK